MSSGTLIRDARTRARLSQTDLAHRAGIARSVINAYEPNRCEPGLTAPTKLVESTGRQLVLELEALPGPRLGLPDTRLGRRLRRHRRAVLERTADRGASDVRVFGSVARGQESARTSTDLLVDLAPDVGLFALGALTRGLSDI